MKKLKNKSIRDIFRAIDNRIGFAKFGMIWYSNWYNPFATIWFNIRSFPITQAWHLPVSVYGRPKLFNLIGDMKIEGAVSFGMIKFNQTRPTSPSNMGIQSEILNQGQILFCGRGVIGTGCKIRIAPYAILKIGDDFKIADQVNIGCYSRIEIGKQTRIAHRCQILDANYHYVANYQKGIVPSWTKPINIGNGCWICNSTTITGGAVIPNLSIIASNSLVNKDFGNVDPSSLIGGCPAKYIATGFRRVENKECEVEIWRFYQEHPNEMFKIPDRMTPEMVSNYID